MSGGHFNYKQYELGWIADEIEQTIVNNGKKKDYKVESWEKDTYPCYPPEVIEKFREAVNKVKEAQIYINRVDWLLSGDDGNETFLKRLNDDLTKLYGK